MTLFDKLKNESAIVFLHSCPRLLDFIQQSPTLLYLSRESVGHYGGWALTYLVATRISPILNAGKSQKVFQDKRDFLQFSNSPEL